MAMGIRKRVIIRRKWAWITSQSVKSSECLQQPGKIGTGVSVEKGEKGEYIMYAKSRAGR